MPSPSKFIANSDLASTPAPMSGAVVLTITTPASQYVAENTIVEYKTETTISDDFDFVYSIITCNEEPDICAYNRYASIDQYGVRCDASINIVGNKIQLWATYSSLLDATFTGSYTFRAIVIPMKSPYSQS